MKIQKRLCMKARAFILQFLINDFLVRGKNQLLNIRRRRWIDKSAGAYFSRDLHVVAEGTHITQEFASFLKGVRR